MKIEPDQIESIVEGLPEIIYTYWRLIQLCDFQMWLANADGEAEASGDWSMFEVLSHSKSAWVRFVGGPEKAHELTQIIAKDAADLPPLTEGDIAHFRKLAKDSDDYYSAFLGKKAR